MNPQLDLLDPDDYLYLDTYNRIRKTFPSLTWDDVVRRGLEEWSNAALMMMQIEKEEKYESD